MGKRGRTISKSIRTTSRAAIKVASMRWFPGAVIALVVLVGMALQWAPLYSIEYAAYGIMSRLRPAPETESPVVMVAIDDRTVSALGSLSPPRSVMAEAMRIISNSGASVIAMEDVYSAPSTEPALEQLRSVSGELKEERKLLKNRDARKVYNAFTGIVAKADPDAMLVESMGIRAKVVLPLFMTDSPEAPEHEPPGRHSLKMPDKSKADPLREFKKLRNPLFDMLNPVANSAGMDAPFEALMDSAKALGHVNILPDPDGAVRSERLLWAHGGRLYPSLALRAAMRYEGVTMEKLSLEKPSGVMMGRRGLPTDSAHRLGISYGADIKRYSFGDILTGTVDPSALSDKIVLVGHDSTHTPRYRTPFGPDMSALMIRANVLDNILGGRHIARPSWAFGLECAVIIYFGLIAAFIIPRLRFRSAGFVVLLSLVPVLLTSAVLFITMGLWLMVFAPALVLALGYGVLLAREFVVFGNRTELVREHIEANRMLGQELQSRGNLDSALEKYMKCPPSDPTIKEALYNLALDFERKRMQNKAARVYERLLEAGTYRDAAEKLAVIRAAESSRVGVLSGSGPRAEGTIISDGAGALPTLGRYEISRELGRGAMGVVYLGRDPKINREVAIKTLLYDEIEPEQLDEIKRRFFQEAEAAGKLSHPNILTIYDAGEEHDMAYLAMEVLEGVDLKEHCKGESLLSVPEVLRAMAQVAEALDYAHHNGVIHRDIKPANIMRLGDGTVKVTDFGIARVVESSKTQTGMVLGTPSYMSPEQVSGKKVDGRSDLFSLGSTMYELLTAKKAFTGDTITGIMYNITNGRYTPLAETGAKLPPCVTGIVDGLLQKSLARRFKRGAEAAEAMRRCMETVS